jgi:hypothetical protein
MGLVKEDLNQLSLVFRLCNLDSRRNPTLPRTLLDLFSAKHDLEPPSLTSRIPLALQIARIVRDFHRTDWLHKDLRSEKILFFPP